MNPKYYRLKVFLFFSIILSFLTEIPSKAKQSVDIMVFSIILKSILGFFYNLIILPLQGGHFDPKECHGLPRESNGFISLAIDPTHAELPLLMLGKRMVALGFISLSMWHEESSSRNPWRK